MSVECDVLVAGSGAAGLMAACRAADAGHHVLVVERADTIGGTTATSGGVLWIPANRLMLAAGFPDTPEAGVEHLVAATGGRVSRDQLTWFVTTARSAVDYLIYHTRVQLQPLLRADHYWSLPGAAPAGRALDNLPFDPGEHPELTKVLRPSTYLPSLTMAEREGDIPAADLATLEQARRAQGIRTLGGALVGALAASALSRGVRIIRGERLVGLDRGRDRAWQVRMSGRSDRRVEVRVAVVLATGGFEWSVELVANHLPMAPVPIGAPGNEGDALPIATELGAAVDQLDTWWGVPVLQDPDARYDGRPTGRMASGELAAPGAILVDRDGRRFVDESLNYHDLAHAAAEPGRAPLWLVYDAACAQGTPMAGLPTGTLPSWGRQATTLAELATLIQVPSDVLTASVDRFNAGARAGRDSDYGRGRAPARAVAGTAGLAPLSEPPFFALPVVVGTLGTSGGLVTDTRARVLDVEGRPIQGLFAAGNAAATLFGGSYPGGGASLALAVARGYALGEVLSRL